MHKGFETITWNKDGEWITRKPTCWLSASFLLKRKTLQQQNMFQESINCIPYCCFDCTNTNQINQTFFLTSNLVPSAVLVECSNGSTKRYPTSHRFFCTAKAAKSFAFRIPSSVFIPTHNTKSNHNKFTFAEKLWAPALYFLWENVVALLVAFQTSSARWVLAKLVKSVGLYV